MVKGGCAKDGSARGRPTLSEPKRIRQDLALKKASAFAEQSKYIENVVKIMNRSPQLCEEMANAVEDIEEKFKNSIANDTFPRNYYRIRQAGPMLLIQVLMKLLPKKSQNFWSRIKAAPKLPNDLCPVAQTFYIVTVTHADDPLVFYRQVFIKQMVDRALQYGKRHEEIVVNSAGFIDFKKWGYYSFRHDEGGDLAHVRHINGKEVAIPEGMKQGEWEIENNHSEQDAIAKKVNDFCSIKLSLLFGEEKLDPFLAEMTADEQQKQVALLEKEAADEKIAQASGAGGSKVLVGKGGGRRMPAQ